MKKLVKGEGPKSAKIVFIGEAPGKEEEKMGRPFVGRAGRFLRASLKQLDIAPAKTYITNVVKFRPQTKTGENRKPTQAEVKLFLPRLKKELLKLNPRIIVLLGDTALRALLGERYQISRHRGRIVKRGHKKYLISYHPAAAVRNAKVRTLFLTDLKKLKIFRGIKNFLSKL